MFNNFIVYFSIIYNPPWCFDTWKHSSDNNFNGKYKYLYMGFGNGLCIDYSIYKEFELYLDDLVDRYLEKCVDDDKKNIDIQQYLMFGKMHLLIW